MNNLIPIGRILKPRGLKGELKVDIYSKEYRNILIAKEVSVGNIFYIKKSTVPYGGFVYITLEGIDSLEKALTLKDMEICIDREDFKELPDGYNYVVDLLGCTVLVSNEEIGCLIDIYNYSDRYIYVIKGKGTFHVPVVDGLILSKDLRNKLIKLDSDVFKRVGVEN